MGETAMPTRKSPAKKTPAKKSPAKKAPTPKKSAKKAAPKKSPAKRGGDPECSSGSMFEKKALNVKGKRNRIMSRLVMDDNFMNSDNMPTGKMNAVLPKKRVSKPKKKEDPEDDRPAKKSGKSNLNKA